MKAPAFDGDLADVYMITTFQEVGAKVCHVATRRTRLCVSSSKMLNYDCANTSKGSD